MADNRADSARVQSEIMADALKGKQPPGCTLLEPKEQPFFDLVVEARAVWTNIDLVHAVNLARCLCSIEENQILLKCEGDVIMNQRGTPIMNPRFTILEQLSRRAAALSTKIQVHAIATVGESKQSKGKNMVKRSAIEAMEDTEDDDLIGRPN